MRKFFTFLDSTLKLFRKCFSRDRAFRNFLLVVIAMMAKSDSLGVTSLARSIALDPEVCFALLHLFHSTAWSVMELWNQWVQIAYSTGVVYEIDGKPALVGDHVNQRKEGRHTPGVKKLHQQSGDSSKGEYIYGKQFGAVSVLIGSPETKLFCLPLSARLHGGVKHILQWSGRPEEKMSCAERLVSEAASTADIIKRESFLLMDRYFMNQPRLTMLDSAPGGNLLTLVAKRKDNAAANKTLAQKTGKRGRPGKTGEKVKLFDLFTSMAGLFQSADLEICGKVVKASYFHIDLFWGEDIQKPIRFVLSIIDGEKSILCRTDLSANPLMILKLYSFRFKIETQFRAQKQTLQGFFCHFWTMSMPRLDKSASAAAWASKLLNVDSPRDRIKITECYERIEKYVMITCIALGLLQICSLKFHGIVTKWPGRWLLTRTNKCPSEASVSAFVKFAAESRRVPDDLLIGQLIKESASRLTFEDDEEEAV
jgi:hypothetical protein